MQIKYIIQDIRTNQIYCGMVWAGKEEGKKGNEYIPFFDSFPCYPVFYKSAAEAAKQINSSDFKNVKYRIITIVKVYHNI